MASDGYPVSYEKGFEIKGLENFENKEGYYVFHAGTKAEGDKIVTNGGRVLGVTAKGKDLKEARANAYEATKLIDFENGKAEVILLADWDTVKTNKFASRAIAYLLNCENEKLPKEIMVAFE